MKTTFLCIALLTVIISCNSYQPTVSNNSATSTIASDTLRIANDSLEYEIIIIEPGFNSWLVTQPPRGFYSQSTLELRNNFSVREYNLRVNNPLRYSPDLYMWRIDYDPKVNYGYEVNYLLYNYFLFFEKRYGQKLR
ncbi:hypothetical protein FNJ87_20600 [Nonlabens mediterrranea]|uniref:Lipoprotein n=1 Tax=Nonlabens mediterrranea TaxID=1419947 RepID=A0ABS0ABD1_9FLAO|nr:hypothetical protein [Nonlabens mediterrranea]